MRSLQILLLLLFSLPAVAQAYTVLVIGDSLSAAYGIDESQGWVQLTEQRLREQIPEIAFVNASISGDSTAGGVRRIGAALARFEPDLVIIELGGNDGLRGYPPTQMRDNLVEMTKQAQQAGARVLLLGMQIPTNYGPAFTRQFQDAFVEAAELTGAALLPFLLEPIATERRWFQADGIHPNAEAQPLLVDHVLPALKPLLAEDGVL